MRSAILATALLLALCYPQATPAATAPPPPSAFERWLGGDGPPALPPGLEALRERLGATTSRVEGSFHHDPESGLRFDFVFAVRRPPAEAAKAVESAQAFAKERSAPAVPALAREEVEVERVPLDGSPDHEVRVHYVHALPAAPGIDTVEAVAARWKGLADPTVVPAFLREAVRPLWAVACDGVPGPCTYWTLTLAEPGDLVARARAIAAAAERHGFAYDPPHPADPTDSSVTGFQDCSGAALTTRVWGDRLHVTLQLSGAGTGTRPVAECSREAGEKGR